MRTGKLSSVKVYSPQSQVKRLRWEDEKRVVLIEFLCIPNGTGGKVNEMACELATSILRHRTGWESKVVTYVRGTSPAAGSPTSSSSFPLL